MKPPNLQTWEWGQTLWLYETHTVQAGGLSVGLVSLSPGRAQAEHKHHSDDQVIYVMKGEGTHVVDKEVHVCRIGDVIHIPSGATHEMGNTGREDFVFLAVFTRAAGIQEKTRPAVLDNLPELTLSGTFRELAATFSSLSELSISVIDGKGTFILEPVGLPRICLLEDGTPCPALAGRMAEFVQGMRRDETAQLLTCCGSLQIVAVPLVAADGFLGAVICGHGLLSAAHGERVDAAAWTLGAEKPATACALHRRADLLAGLRALPVTARSKMFHLAESLAAAIIRDFEADLRSANERALLEETQKRLHLEQALHEIDLKLLQSQMNPHFLFNSLNAVVGTALLENAPKTGQLAAALSRLLSYTLGKNNRLVKLAEVVEYLRSYFEIFAARYEERFSYRIDLAPDCGEARIPFMSVHPLVENAVVHGLERVPEPGAVAVSFRRYELSPECLEIRIENSGTQIDAGQLLAARRIMAGGPSEDGGGLGLKIVRHQLQQFFGVDYVFSLDARAGGGAVTRLILPFVTDPDPCQGGGAR